MATSGNGTKTRKRNARAPVRRQRSEGARVKVSRYVICPASKDLHPKPVAMLVRWGNSGWPHYKCDVCHTRGFLPKTAWTRDHGLTLDEAKTAGCIVLHL